MTLETIFEKFDLFADAPDAVAKMRELVLDLAIQGRLVSHSPNDEPADTLAATIAEDRAAFVKERRLARQRVFRPVEDDQCPFALPSGWVWTRLGNLCRVQAGFAFESAAFIQGDSGVPMIRIRDITKDHTQVNYVGEYRQEFLVDTDDYLVGMDGNFTVAKWRGPRALLNQRVSRLQWYSRHLEPSFFAVALQHRLSELQGTKAYTTVDHLSSGQIENAVVPLPPLAEQKRIVAKVDELMALCDRLEAQQEERETRHAALARASLARFADAPTPANLHFLFHPSYVISPADLRKSILTLAVQGKLVPQDPNDEPAASLISQIAEEKRRLVAARIIREKDEAAPIADDELPFEVPYGWEWMRLSSITRRIHYGYTASAKSELKDVRLLRITDIQNNFVDWSSVPGCEIAKDEVAQYQLERSDILVARTGGTVGKTYLVQEVPEVAVFASYLIRIQGGSALFDRYLKLFLESPTYWVQLEEGARGAAQPNVNGQTLGRMVVSVPPLAEQRRIVAKVEQLMALVDALETQLVASRATAEKLLAAVVAELTEGTHASTAC